MGFVMDGLDTEAYDRTYSDSELVRRIVGYFRPYRSRMIVVAIMLALGSLARAGGPILLARAIDVLAESLSAEAIWTMAAAVLVFGVSAWVFNYIQQMLSTRVVGSVVLNLREDVFGATIRHDLSFFDEHPTGKTVSRVTSDTQDFSTVVTLVIELVSQLLLVAVLSIWLLRIDALLTLLLIGMTPIAAAAALSFRHLARQVTQQARRVTAIINAEIQESISGIMIAKSFRQEQAVYDKFAVNNQQAFGVGLRRGLTLNTIFPIVGIASGVGTALLLYAGGLAVRGGTVSPGNWVLFMQTVGFFWFPILSIASFWSQFQDGLSAAERVFALIDLQTNVVQTAAEPVEELEGRIQFKNLCFTYTGDALVLPDFDLEIRAGETVALVGHTGAGKSSLARLLARFYEFQGGQLLIDGRDIRRLDLGQYRRHIGLVPQEPFLFSGTVRDNICYGLARASDQQVDEAAMRIGSGEWVQDLAAGLETEVGERGASLSMGQRQLVALARVLLKDPAILILDEATASVDPFTEAQIQEGLEEVMRGRTAVVIAHRLSTVRHVDRIVVLRDGRIIEEGNHESLLEAGGHYAELYNTYFRHQSLEYIEQARTLLEASP
jgi:ABC-type multidrug transport system fused ATPase/permease subunit